MSNKYILVVLEMLYRMKKKFEKLPYYCEMRPKTKKWCETYDVDCISTASLWIVEYDQASSLFEILELIRFSYFVASDKKKYFVY